MSFRSSTIAVAIAATAACHPSSRPALPANQQTGTAAARLQRDVEGILNDPALAHGTWGVQVESLTRGDTLFAWNSQKLLLPASNMEDRHAGGRGGRARLELHL